MGCGQIQASMGMGTTQKFDDDLQKKFSRMNTCLWAEEIQESALQSLAEAHIVEGTNGENSALCIRIYGFQTCYF